MLYEVITKLALEDGIGLARALKDHPDDLEAALQSYEAERSVEVLKIQNAARNSTEWFENVKRYTAFEAEQFAYGLLTRSHRITSYNVCYTKLLRQHHERGPHPDPARHQQRPPCCIPLWCQPTRGAAGRDSQRSVRRRRRRILVITSYSIHYTKLYEESVSPTCSWGILRSATRTHMPPRPQAPGIGSLASVHTSWSSSPTTPFSGPSRLIIESYNFV